MHIQCLGAGQSHEKYQIKLQVHTQAKRLDDVKPMRHDAEADEPIRRSCQMQ